MAMAISQTALLLLLLLLLSSTIASCASTTVFPAIFNFGDSNSDTGDFAAAFPPLLPPYGETFFGHPAGRFSDGRLLIDFIATALRIPFLSPYLQTVGANFRHGANFAYATATVLEPNASFSQSGTVPFSLLWQFRQFQALRNLALRSPSPGEDDRLLPRPSDFGQALYTLDIGQNDIADNVADYTPQQMESYSLQIVDQIEQTIKGLYDEGARTFLVSNVGPIGCLPYLIAFVPPERKSMDENGCQAPYNQAALRFNERLRERLQHTKSELSDATVVYMDTNSIKYELISNASVHGFRYKTRVCCGVGGGELNFSGSIRCGNSGEVNGSTVTARSCAHPGMYVNWDGVHNTEAANRYIANQIVQQYLSVLAKLLPE